MLHSLYLFKNVRITPDYSVVHDLSPENWRTYLIGDSDTAGQGDLVWQGDVNYYRLPDVIRIEGNYDNLRKATYGMISGNEEADPQEMVVHSSMQRPMFFWINDVRLVKQGCRVDLQDESRPWQKDYFDVVELSISVDVWSSNNGSFSLYDSYVERKHMPRWKNTGTSEDPVWEPIYYPNAAQGIEGAYLREDTQKVVPSKTISGKKYNFAWIILSLIDSDGKAKIVVGVKGNDDGTDYDERVYTGNGRKKVFNYEDIISGAIYTELNTTADFVQSIVVLPCLGNNRIWADYIEMTEFSPGDERLTLHNSYEENGSNLGWFDITRGWDNMLRNPVESVIVPIAPDHEYEGDPEDPDATVYYDEHEPMMYFSPARVRKVVTGMGGEMFTLPDVASLEAAVKVAQMYDFTGTTLIVYLKNSIAESNAIGALGAETCATLPIFNSAWKSYEAINKVGDEIAFNAKQMQTIGGGLTNTALAGIGGMVQGGPIGAVLGVVGGATGTILGAVGNEEELKAKRTTIKNSPCTMKSGGSGLGAVITWNCLLYYITLKMDDVSMEKLRFMYYWFGYHVNRTFKGIIDTHTRTKFDFIKTNGAKVKGDLTAGAAREIGSIFDKGVTIYHGPEGYALIGSGDMVSNDEV